MLVEALLHDCARAATAALCDSLFSVRDEAWGEMYAAVYPYARAAIESYIEFSRPPALSTAAA